MAVSTISIRDLYATAGTRTPSASARATAGATPQPGGPPMEEGAPGFVARAAGNPVYGAAVLVGMLIGLYYLARYMPGAASEDFRNIRVTPYNVLIISLAAIVGSLFWKVIVTRFPIPHVGPAILAA